MDSTKQIARLAGVLYLLLVIGGVFSLMYVRGAVIVPGDAAATTESILDHATMLRIDLVVGQVSMVVFMLVALLLYQLLKHVHQAAAVVMALVVLVHLPQGLVTLLLQFGALELAHGEGFMATLDLTQREVMAALCLHLVGKSAILSEFSWGLWLLPLGALVYRSGFLPRFLGIWLILNGLAYMILSFLGIFAPTVGTLLSKYAFPILLGEVALTVYLLYVGFRPTRPDNQP